MIFESRVLLELPINYYILHLFNGPFFQDNLGKPTPERQPILGFNEARDNGWSGISWTICKSFAPCKTDNHGRTSPLSFYRPDAPHAT